MWSSSFCGHDCRDNKISKSMVWGPAQSIALVQDMRSLEWQVADMLSLPFQRGIFDAVIEKGTMDVLFVDNESPWDPTPEVRSRVLTMLDETHR